MNSSEKVELILIYGECNRISGQAAARVYADRYHPHHNYVLRLLRGLNENGQFPSNGNKQKQPRLNHFDEDTELQVMAYNLHTCLFTIINKTCISTNWYISWCSTYNFEKKNKMHPYINLSFSDIYESEILNVDYNFCDGLAFNLKTIIYFIIIFCGLMNLYSQTMVILTNKTIGFEMIQIHTGPEKL